MHHIDFIIVKILDPEANQFGTGIVEIYTIEKW